MIMATWRSQDVAGCRRTFILQITPRENSGIWYCQFDQSIASASSAFTLYNLRLTAFKSFPGSTHPGSFLFLSLLPLSPFLDFSSFSIPRIHQLHMQNCLYPMMRFNDILPNLLEPGFPQHLKANHIRRIHIRVHRLQAIFPKDWHERSKHFCHVALSPVGLTEHE